MLPLDIFLQNFRNEKREVNVDISYSIPDFSAVGNTICFLLS